MRQVALAALHRMARGWSHLSRVSGHLAGQLHSLIQRQPTFGYRWLWVLLRYQETFSVNRKGIYPMLRLIPPFF